MYVVKEDNNSTLVGDGPFITEGRARDIAEDAAVGKPGTVFYVYKAVQAVMAKVQTVEQVVPEWRDVG